MAYQNVGTPRFYINVIEWLNSNGLNATDSDGIPPQYRTLPVNPTLYHSNEFDIPFDLINPYIALLGHNLESDPTYGSDYTDITNGNPGSGFHGWSLVHLSDQPTTFTISTGYGYTIGSILVGSFYEMPHSPDLNLTMTREMDGVKRVRTKGGSDLVDHKYTKPTMWGEAGAWELYGSVVDNQILSRNGRRVWDLSFSYLDDGDVWGSNQSVGVKFAAGGLDTGLIYYLPIDATGLDDEDIQYNTDNSPIGFKYNLLTDDNFYSQVIHKTNGGQLPFMFQPDSSNNNPDQFAICKFDMNSFKFKQVANGVYNVKLKIREVW
tara:strand:+ start:4242 stop:5204 length:963 start_codon:yes stop_codon:yes gene_type:complete